MAVKYFILVFASAYCVGTAMGQCFGRQPTLGAGFSSPFPGRPFDGLTPTDGSPRPSTGCSIGPLPSQQGLAASYGGGLSVTSSSPISPTGLIVNSENSIEGTVSCAGQLPFLGAVATDGVFTTAGVGAVSYGCGDGTVGIVAETPISPAASGYVSGSSPYGYASALSGYKEFPSQGRCGCGTLY